MSRADLGGGGGGLGGLLPPPFFQAVPPLFFRLPKTSMSHQITSKVFLISFRHSRLPAGNALWFCQNFFFFFFFSFFRRQGFRMITFDRQAGPLQNFNRSHVMVIGRSVSFSDPARPPGGGVGRPKHPKIPPPRNFFFCMRFRTPGTFLKKKISRVKKTFLSEKNVQLNIPPPPPPTTCTPPPSPQNTHPNPRAIINNPNNCSMTYRL